MKFGQKEKLKIKNEIISEGFHWPNSEEIFFFLITRFLYLVFSLLVKNLEGQLKISTPYLVYSQIWLNLLTDDHHFGDL